MNSEAVRTAARAALEARRTELVTQLAEGVEPPGQITYGSQAAAASQVFAQQRDLALRQKAERDLALVDAALARLGTAGWGSCVQCGQPIDRERLSALPWADRCVDCQRRERVTR